MEGTAYYKVFYDDDPGSGCRLGRDGNAISCKLLAHNVSGTVHTHSSPDPEDNYYWVVACNNSGCSDIDSDDSAAVWSATNFVARHHVIDGVVALAVKVDPNCTADCERTSYPGPDSTDYGTLKEVTGVDLGLSSLSSFDHMTRLVAWVDSNPRAKALVVRTYADIERAQEEADYARMFYLQRRPPESGWDLQGDVENLQVWHDAGLRVLQLAYGASRKDARLPGERLGYGSDEGDEMGLTDIGRAAIAEMNTLGMIVDVSHCSKQTTLDAAALSTKPIIATHVNAEALTPVTRNKDDEELIAIAETGGLIGVTPIRAFLDTNRDGSAGIDDMIAHIEYMVSLVGIDHVGIASDSDLDGWEKTSYYYADADLAAMDRWVRLASRLYARGWTEEDLAKLLGGNFRRVFSETLAAS